MKMEKVMIVLVLCFFFVVIITLTVLRLSKYRNKLEPNSQIIVALLNSLESKKISKK